MRRKKRDRLQIFVYRVKISLRKGWWPRFPDFFGQKKMLLTFCLPRNKFRRIYNSTRVGVVFGWMDAFPISWWDLSLTLWAIKLKFDMVVCYGDPLCNSPRFAAIPTRASPSSSPVQGSTGILLLLCGERSDLFSCRELSSAIICAAEIEICLRSASDQSSKSFKRFPFKDSQDYPGRIEVFGRPSSGA